MRFFLAISLAVLLLGCISNKTAETVSNQTVSNTSINPPVPNITENQTITHSSQNMTSGNISTISVNGTANITVNSTNQTNTTSAKKPTLPFENGKYSLVLDDVSLIPTSEQPCGIFSVRQNDTVMYKLLICPGESEEWVSPEGHAYRIEVIKVAAGYSGGGYWAQVIIFG